MGDDRRSKRKRPGSRVPEELVEEILYCLPTKSLFRFGCVSRSWSSIIARRRTLLPMSGLYFNSELGSGDYLVPITNDGVEDCRKMESCLCHFSKSQLKDVCNGLLLFFHGFQSEFSVLNPNTMESVDIPTVPCPLPVPSRVFLLYDPLVSPHYQILLFSNDGANDWSFGIYSSVTENWVKVILRGLPVPRYMCNHVYLNGALYYLFSCRTSVLRLDVETMQFEVIVLPNSSQLLAYPCNFNACIGVSRGHVCYVGMSYYETGMEVWMLEEKGNVRTWLSKHSTDGQTFARQLKACGYPEVQNYRTVRPLTFHSDSEVIYVRILNKVFSYHPDDGERLVEICDVTDMYRTFTFTPSLESISPPGSTILRW